MKEIPNIRFNIFKAKSIEPDYIDLDLGMKQRLKRFPVEWIGAKPNADDFIIEVVDHSSWPVKVQESSVSDPRELYFYNVFVERVYDGDTATKVLITLANLGFIEEREWSVRLLGLYTPEMNEPNGPEMAQVLKGHIEGQWAILATERDKDGKYGRLLGTFFKDQINVNEAMKRALNQKEG